jgi:hypothetical protein
MLVGEDRKVYEAARSQGEEVKRVERLVTDFAARVPELKFYHFYWSISNHLEKQLIMWRYGSRGSWRIERRRRTKTRGSR